MQNYGSLQNILIFVLENRGYLPMLQFM